MIALALTGGFMLGLSGSTHCVTMCGPLAAVTCRGAGAERARNVALTQLGRVTAYVTLGTLSGLIGQVLVNVTWVAWGQIALRIVAGLAVIAAGLSLSGLWRGSSVGPSGWVLSKLSPLLERQGHRAAWLRGAFWGLLPCGLSASGLALALGTGSAFGGAVTMAAFAFGTLPAILGVSVAAGWLPELARMRQLKLAGGLLMALVGAMQIHGGINEAQALQATPEGAPRPCCAAKNAASHAEGALHEGEVP